MAEVKLQAVEDVHSINLMGKLKKNFWKIIFGTHNSKINFPTLPAKICHQLEDLKNSTFEGVKSDGLMLVARKW